MERKRGHGLLQRLGLSIVGKLLKGNTFMKIIDINKLKGAL